MSRYVMLCMPPLLVACGPRTDEHAAQRDAVQQNAVHADSVTPSRVVEIQHHLAPLRIERDSLIQLARADAGTVSGDRQLLHIRQRLTDRVTQLTAAFNDSAFQLAIDPYGWRAQQYDRAPVGITAPRDSAAAKAWADSLASALRTSGVWPHWAEGDTYLLLHEKWYLDAVSPYVTESARKYLALERLEQEQPTGADGSIMIPWTALAERLAMSDELAAADPQAPFIKNLTDRRNRYLVNFLTGSDNTPVFGRRTRTLEPDVRKAIENFVQQHAELPAAGVVREYLQLLEASNYERTAAVQAFMRELWLR